MAKKDVHVEVVIETESDIERDLAALFKVCEDVLGGIDGRAYVYELSVSLN